VRRTIRRFAFGRARQHPRLDLIGHFVAFATGVARVQARQAIHLETFALAVDVAVAAVELGANLCPCQTLCQQQDQP
jgi:hypothetical protein